MSLSIQGIGFQRVSFLLYRLYPAVQVCQKNCHSFVNAILVNILKGNQSERARS